MKLNLEDKHGHVHEMQPNLEKRGNVYMRNVLTRVPEVL